MYYESSHTELNSLKLSSSGAAAGRGWSAPSPRASQRRRRIGWRRGMSKRACSARHTSSTRSFNERCGWRGARERQRFMIYGALPAELGRRSSHDPSVLSLSPKHYQRTNEHQGSPGGVGLLGRGSRAWPFCGCACPPRRPSRPSPTCPPTSPGRLAAAPTDLCTVWARGGGGATW
jgi:hypothetical protein